MNSTLESFAREQIKQGLKLLPVGWQTTFKRFYSHNNLDMDIFELVDKMPADKLDWALSQVENSIRKMEKQVDLYKSIL